MFHFLHKISSGLQRVSGPFKVTENLLLTKSKCITCEMKPYRSHVTQDSLTTQPGDILKLVLERKQVRALSDEARASRKLWHQTVTGEHVVHDSGGRLPGAPQT